MGAPDFLVVTASRKLADRILERLRAGGFEGVLTTDYDGAVTSMSAQKPGMVLMEVASVTGPALQLIRIMKSEYVPEFLPVVALVTAGTPGAVPEALSGGADDAVAVETALDELLPRVRALLRIKDSCDYLCLTNRRLMELSTRDELTGLNNRRYFFERLAIEFERAVRYQQPLSCIMLDMDEFKPINDTFGHLVGDALFRRAAALFQSIPRKVDVVARYGGDEVAVLLPATQLESALALGERLRDVMARQKFEIGGRTIAMTVSVGVSVLDPSSPISPDQLISRADLALYAAKHRGKNSICVWSPELEQQFADHQRSVPPEQPDREPS